MSIVHTKHSGVAFVLVTVLIYVIYINGTPSKELVLRNLISSMLSSREKIKDLAIGCLKQITLIEGLCLTTNVLLLQTCVESKKTSLWIDTIIPYNTS